MMDWMKEVEFDDLLDKDAALVYHHCGVEVFFALWENLPGLNIYISAKPIMEAKKRYVRKFYTGSNAKELAILLDVSERFIQKACATTDVDVKDNRQGKLIPD